MGGGGGVVREEWICTYVNEAVSPGKKKGVSF